MNKSKSYIIDNVLFMITLYHTDEGWWKSSTGEIIHEVAGNLYDKGLTEQEIHDIISPLISAMREEYGD